MPNDAFLNYGAMGVFALCLAIALKVVFARLDAAHQRELADKQTAIQRETDRADRNEAALRELERTVREQTTAAIVESTNTTKAVLEFMAHERARRSG